MSVMVEGVKFKRLRSGFYRDESTGWTIERDGGSPGRHDQRDWLVRDAAGTVQRIRQSFAEAELAAHAALAESRERDGRGRG